MANDANLLDCERDGFWSLLEQDPTQDFSKSYYEKTKVILEEQIAKAGYRVIY